MVAIIMMIYCTNHVPLFCVFDGQLMISYCMVNNEFNQQKLGYFEMIFWDDNG